MMKSYLVLLGLWFIIMAFYFGIESEKANCKEISSYVFGAFLYFFIGIAILMIAKNTENEL